MIELISDPKSSSSLNDENEYRLLDNQQQQQYQHSPSLEMNNNSRSEIPLGNAVLENYGKRLKEECSRTLCCLCCSLCHNNNSRKDTCGILLGSFIIFSLVVISSAFYSTSLSVINNADCFSAKVVHSMCEQGQLNCTQYGGPPLEIKGSTFGPDKFLNLAPTNELNMTFNGTLLNVVEFTCPLLCSNDSIQWTTLCEEKTENVTITERFCLNSNSDYCASLTSLYIQGINEIFRHHDVSGSILFSYFLRPILPSLIFNVFNFFRKFLFNFSHINSLGAAMVTVAMLALFYVTLFIAVAIKYSILLGAPNLVSVLVSSIVTAVFVQWVLEFLVMPPILALVPTSRFDSYEKSQTGELCTEACCFGKSLCEMWFVRKLTYLNNQSSTDKEEEMTKEKSKPTEFTFVVVMVSLQVIVWTMYAFSLMALGKVITWSYILFYQTLFNYLLTKIMIFYERRYLNAKGDAPKRRLLFMFSIFTFIGVFVVCVSIHILTVVLIPFVNYYW